MELDLALISLGEGVLLGVYQNNFLCASYTSKSKTSEALVEVFSQLFEDFKNPTIYPTIHSDLPAIKGVYYAKGPGSFTSLKLTHVFLHTLALIHDFELYSTTGFDFNDNTPILAYANKYFISKEMESLSDFKDLKIAPKDFMLPSFLEKDKFTQLNTPFYILPPI
ncbi:tRNA (adenosine(37)-N6)-threonylcarbamoyltransferase complex dimerization subunit type 1 TsaB [Helicobacter pylori]|uniref:tRNA (adenosine(37)-N6)-threonylcarbamoyltransferase complex dimerization subunit type 1 TsaB n=1 Tax=Helicobacter pylori TaxID=210 RepID=UPI0018E322AA|nr:tRNA (adenosine(37)-N6)-threonylcarbamoyltransferase complex dimerization subunit type 1 TsaB [Helicobacter pylori]WRE51995.1 tRNA (adenosine(37)-N6)-threonylcarbamoyltransferase complex dimerization subunit type 1 TsaB [Helicobacter pylori]